MAVTRYTMQLAEQLRIVVNLQVDTAVRQLVEAWARAWQVIDREWVLAMDELVELSTDGRWPSETKIRKAAKAQAALQAATREIHDLTEFTGVTVVSAARNVTDQVAFWQARIVASQLPPDRHMVPIKPMPDHALAAVVERTTQQIESLKRPLSRDAREAMRQALIRGVAIGENPRATARRMVDRAEHRFAGGLTRAMTIARTEILDAHRSAAAAWQFEQTTLRGWVWNAKLDARTCPSCWAKHGSVHPLTEVGPNDHQQGRCARTPLVKSWADLGFDDIEEPPSALPDAQAVFDSLSPTEQLAIMGPVRLKALRDGVLEWNELSVKRETPGWRDSWGPVPVGKARRRLVVSAT